jgi:hypothetical protein
MNKKKRNEYTLLKKDAFFVAYLVETNIVGVFTETLTADVQVVLADQTSAVSTDTTSRDC